MHRTDLILFYLLLFLLMSSCIRSYNPEILAKDEKKYVVSGQVVNGDSLQNVNVSMTSPVDAPKYIPVEGCLVRIIDSLGNIFPMNDAGKGNYTTAINPQFLQPGSSFKVEVSTPDGEMIASDFDHITSCPEMDSVYYVRKDLENNLPGVFTLGIQFYTNLKGTLTDSRYYRWEALETWEYHADYPLEWYYDGTVHHVYPPDYSRKVCWITKMVPDIFTLTTDNLQENSFNMIALQYVDNRTTKLAYGYSLLIRQYALSQTAFIYWEQLRINSDPKDGLYEKQPLAIKGNMHNLTHPESIVLGFFSATSLSSRRIFIRKVPDLPLYFDTGCDPVLIRGGLAGIKPKDYPVYLLGNSTGYSLFWMDLECVNCLLMGGINIKPSFWPN